LWLNSKKCGKNGFWWTVRVGSGVLRVARGGFGAKAPALAARAQMSKFPTYFHRNPGISNTFSLKSPKFQTGFCVSKLSACKSKEFPGRLNNLEFQNFESV